jgi:nucleoside-triphosphatase THEP1
MNEEEYRIYLSNAVNQQGNNFTSTKINEFINDLKKTIPDHMEQNINLLDEDNTEILRNIKLRLVSGGDLYHFHNEDGNGRPSSAMYHYINFLKEYYNLKEIIKIFIDKWDKTTGMWRNEFVENYNLNHKGYSLSISYGQGNRQTPPKFPYISFLKDGNIVSNGIYPYIKYKHTDNTLYTSLNYSKDNRPNYSDDILTEIENYEEYNFNIDDIDNLIKQVNKNIIAFEKILDINKPKPNPHISINTKNIILYGAPGVGKTHNYQNLISMIEDNTKSELEIFETITNNNEKIELHQKTFQDIEDDERVEFVTFHQNYSYEDFIEGFRPNEDDNIKLEDGIFKNIVNKALEQQNKNFYIVIDEINRGNISKIFGELITLIEEDKRANSDVDGLEVTLPYSKKLFKIPSNLYIVATMNSTDKSIATIDIALRRRFTFLKMKPNLELVDNIEAKILMSKLNDYIKLNINEDYMLGHSYFMKVQNDEDLEFVKEYKIKPLLEEYFYADDEKLQDVLKRYYKETNL